MLDHPLPELDELLNQIGETGARLDEIQATEGAAGNISVYVGWPLDPGPRFPLRETIPLPVPAPELAGRLFLVTGSGRRLREIVHDPEGNLGALIVKAGGLEGDLYTSPRRRFQRLTSEFNTHLAVHKDQVALSGTNFHAVVHAQPLHLTFLSHLPRYQDETYLNRRLLRWQPELILQLPEGLGVEPFKLPGSDELMAVTTASLRTHRLVVWCKHGVVARSDQAPMQACDRIEYAEAAAHYEYLNLATGEPGHGLTDEEIRAICAAYNVEQTLF